MQRREAVCLFVYLMFLRMSLCGSVLSFEGGVASDVC